MEIVADANVVFSALIRNSYTRKLFYREEINLLSPDFLLEELAEHKKEIAEKSGLDEQDFDSLTAVLTGLIELVPVSDFSQEIAEALKFSPDAQDAPYFALCLARNAPLWSNDAKLKKQEKVEVYSTEEMIRKLDKP